MTIYLLRHGESFYSRKRRIGGDSGLTEKGFEQAEKISSWLTDKTIKVIYTSTLKRAVQTAEALHRLHPKIPLIKTPSLCEILAGVMDSMTYKEFEERFQEQYKERYEDKYHWSYPLGESYATMLERVKRLLEEVKEKDAAIVAHSGINRAILGYYLNLPTTEIPCLTIPHETIFVIEPQQKKASHIKEGRIKEGYKIESMQ